MARSALSVQEMDSGGLDVALEAANVDGNSFPNTGREVLKVVNNDASGITVTLQTPKQVAGLDVAEETISVPAAGTRYIGRLKPRDLYNQSDGHVYVDYSAVANVEVGVFRV